MNLRRPPLARSCGDCQLHAATDRNPATCVESTRREKLTSPIEWTGRFQYRRGHRPSMSARQDLAARIFGLVKALQNRSLVMDHCIPSQASNDMNLKYGRRQRMGIQDLWYSI